MTEHTKGPWTCSQVAHYIYPNEKHFIVADNTDTYIGEANTKANARLIAAAPEMLEYLKDLEEWFSDPSTFYLKEWPMSLADMIAKVEGKELKGVEDDCIL